MQFTATQIATLLNGTVIGNANSSVTTFGKIEEATDGQLTFLANPKYEEYLYTTKASIVILNTDYILKQPINATIITVTDAYTAFATLLSYYQKMQMEQVVGIEQPSYIDPTATIGNNVYVGAFAYIGKNATIGNDTKIYPQSFVGNNVTVGDNTTINAGVKIYNDCVVGNHVTIHSGTIIGSDGFGFAPQTDGSYKKVPQIGNVIIENYVEIGANCAIDRATIGSTIIREGAKLDNLIQIAHNVEIGTKTVIAAQVGISGSTKLGSNIVIGGQAGIAGHLTIGNGTKINGRAGVTKTIKKENTALNGNPAVDFMTEQKRLIMIRQLPELERRLKAIEAELGLLTQK